MTADEQKKFEAMEQGVQKIERDVELIKSALLGNVLSGEEGLVGENKTMKLRQDTLEKEIKELRDERIRTGVYIKIIVWLLAVIGAGVVGFIVNSTLQANQQQQTLLNRLQIEKLKQDDK